MANPDTTYQSLSSQLLRGDNVVMPLLLDAAATAAIGQVLQYDRTAHNWVDYTGIKTDVELTDSGTDTVDAPIPNGPFAVCFETKTLSGDTAVLCVVKGHVLASLLDATSLADDDYEAALLSSGIIPTTEALR